MKFEKLRPAESVYLAEKARRLRLEGRKIVALVQGDPHFPPPESIKKGINEALEKGFTHYVDSRGLPELREKISRYRFNEKFSPEEILIVPGVKQGLFYLFWALEEVQKVVVLEPAWLGYRYLCLLTSKEYVPLKRKDLEKLNDISFDLLIIAHPNNPDGYVYSEEELKWLLRLTASRKAFFMVDEIYSLLVYEEPFVSSCNFSGPRDHLIVLDGFSKSLAMAGLRLGFLATKRRDLLEKCWLLLQHTATCVNSLAQYAALLFPEASKKVEFYRDYYRSNRELVLKYFPEWEVFKPAAGLYFFADLKPWGIKSALDFVDFALSEEGVLLVPGGAYGRGFESWIRLSFCLERVELEEGLKRLRRALEKYMGRRDGGKKDYHP